MTNWVSQQSSDNELYQLSKEQLVDFIKTLQEKIARLEESLNLDSKTSSKSPSTDPVRKSEEKKSQPNADGTTTTRKPGGQPGHEGKTRKGFGRVDGIEILRPEVCLNCGETHFDAIVVNIEVQQVAQLVANPIEIVEYHRQHCQCLNCGLTGARAWPDEMIPTQDLGVKLQALLGWLGNYAHMPYTKMRELLFELGGIDIGEGTLVTTNEHVAQAIEQPVAGLGQWVKRVQPNVHVDETPWSVKGVKEWLWVVAHPNFCLFHAADTRSWSELEQLLGTEYRDVLSSDDFSVYNGYNVATQQKRLAHLRRHFLRLRQQPGKDNSSISNVFVNLIDDVFKNYRQFQDNNDLPQYIGWAKQFKAHLSNALQTWMPKASATTLNLLLKLRDKYEQWWYFLAHPEVTPDNNLAERLLHLAVTKCKVSGGSRSMQWFKNIVSLLTVVQTCRSQGRSVIDFFARSLYAYSGDFQSPLSLVPQFST